MPKAVFGRAVPQTVRRFAMRGRLVFGGGTLALLLAVGSCKDDVGLTSIPPAPERFIAFLSGANEPTPITTPAQGLATDTGFTGLLVDDTITVVDSVLTLMRNGSGYVNVHTRGPTAADGSGGHGGGEIRGQLFRFQ